jgi:hypothetical protein
MFVVLFSNFIFEISSSLSFVRSSRFDCTVPGAGPAEDQPQGSDKCLALQFCNNDVFTAVTCAKRKDVQVRKHNLRPDCPNLVYLFY